MNKILTVTLTVVGGLVMTVVGLSTWQIHKANKLIQELRIIAKDHYVSIKNSEEFKVANFEERSELLFTSISSELSTMLEGQSNTMVNVLTEQARGICASLVLGGL